MFWLFAGIFLVVVIFADIMLRQPIIRAIVPVFEKMPPFGVIESVENPDGQKISFPSTDGLTLRGRLMLPAAGEPQGVAVFFAELFGDHSQASRYMAALLNANIAVLAFDTRNQGSSDVMPGYKPLHWLTEHEINDGLAAVKFVRSHDQLSELPLGLFGVSRGASIALAVGGRVKDLAWVICDGAFTTTLVTRYFAQRWADLYAPKLLLKLVPQWHIHSTISAARLLSEWRRKVRYSNPESTFPQLRNVPVLLISGKRDSYVKPIITSQLHAALGANCEAWIVPKAKHNMARQTAPTEYDQRLLQFVASAVPTFSWSEQTPAPSARISTAAQSEA